MICVFSEFGGAGVSSFLAFCVQDVQEDSALKTPLKISFLRRTRFFLLASGCVLKLRPRLVLCRLSGLQGSERCGVMMSPYGHRAESSNPVTRLLLR